MSLRNVARILGISPKYLSLLLNGKRPWRGNLKERYKELVNTFVNTPKANTSLTKASEDGNVTEKVEVLPIVNFGGAGGTRTPYLFNAIEALSQMSYSPTRNRGEPD